MPSDLRDRKDEAARRDKYSKSQIVFSEWDVAKCATPGSRSEGCPAWFNEQYGLKSYGIGRNGQGNSKAWVYFERAGGWLTRGRREDLKEG